MMRKRLVAKKLVVWFFTLALLAWGLSASEALAISITYKEGNPDPFLGGTYTGTEDTMILTNNGGEEN